MQHLLMVVHGICVDLACVCVCERVCVCVCVCACVRACLRASESRIFGMSCLFLKGYLPFYGALKHKQHLLDQLV